MSYREIEWFTRVGCSYTPSFWTSWLALFRYTNVAITLALFGFGIKQREVYLVFQGVGLTLSWCLNLVLKWALLSPIPTATCGFGDDWCAAGVPDFLLGGSPQPQCAGSFEGNPEDPGCIPCDGPATQPQQIAFFVTATLVFCMQWKVARLTRTHALGEVLLLGFVAYSQVFFGFNTPGQVLSGVWIGAITGCAWQLAYFALVYPRMDYILAWKPVRYYGYRDSFCRAARPAPGGVDPEPMMNWYLEGRKQK